MNQPRMLWEYGFADGTIYRVYRNRFTVWCRQIIPPFHTGRQLVEPRIVNGPAHRIPETLGVVWY